MKTKYIIFLLPFSLIVSSCGVDSPLSNSHISNVSSGTSSSIVTPTPSTTGNSTNPSTSVTPSIIIDEYQKTYSYNPSGEPDFNKQLGIFNPIGNMGRVWESYRGDKIKVAIIDSGFDINHPEFFDMDGKTRISSDSAYIYTNKSNNQINIQKGIQYVDITDGDSHGTMCAGLLGASKNNIGITGVAPNVELLFVKIDKYYLSYAEAFKYAADNGAKIISTSLGAYPNSYGETSGDVHFPAGVNLSNVFQTNINYAYHKGVTIVAATGNNLSTNPTYPAANDNVIGAGGLNCGSSTYIWDEKNGEGSNYNGQTKYVDVFAPSSGIYAPGYDVQKGSHTYWSDGKGTSFSAPIVAGAIALYFQKYPNKTNIDVINDLKITSTNINSYNNKDMGWGALNVEKLLNINVDYNSHSYSPSTTINQDATVLNIIDEEGWDFRTLHLFDLTFEDNYSYLELEKYFNHFYGNKIPTASYQKEGTTKGWGYTDENYIGDYYLCIGNTVHASPTNYQYVFPWWVKSFKYQIVNNNHWFPEGGNAVTIGDSKKEINAYFWYENDYNFGVSQVVGNATRYNFNAITINEILSSKSDKYTSSVYDFYTPNKSKIYYLNQNKNSIYYIKQLNVDTTLFY